MYENDTLTDAEKLLKEQTGNRLGLKLSDSHTKFTEELRLIRSQFLESFDRICKEHGCEDNKPQITVNFKKPYEFNYFFMLKKGDICL